ncbi:DUF4007 family protein [Labilibacter marinus]|uniref:DUF4007 family protein n=1 Tax=Labilibacter marinus TaxID=1477105 RepID=UPI00094F8D87|nr:DUF4007 family protein [Labilibacter marinus]
MNKLKFSGHETFIIRTFWPKKGYDFINNGGSFNADDAVVHLGVGKNMVSSIAFWMKAFGLFDDENKELTELAHFLFGENGVDPYLEDINSIWLLHYNLIKTNFSSIYNAVFNRFRTERIVFTKKQLASFIFRLYKENDDTNFNLSTIEKDIQVFCRLYNTPDYRNIKKDFEDEVSSLMLELELMKSSIDKQEIDGSSKRVEWYNLQLDARPTLSPLIALYVILDQFEGDKNIAMRRLETEPNGPGMVFMLSKEGLYKQLKEIESSIPGVIVSETSGNVVLTLPETINKVSILRSYYAN